MARRRRLISLSLAAAVLLMVGYALAQSAAPGAVDPGMVAGSVAPASLPGATDAPPARGFLSILVFWAGAVVVMAFVGRIVFREHLHERHTLRMLRDSIGKVYDDFDPVQITKWVHLAAPHIWVAWRTRELAGLEVFTTPRFQTELRTRFERQIKTGQRHEARLGKILKVHTLGLYPDGEGPAPKDLALVLRVETRAVDCLRASDQRPIEGKPGERQVQHFWTLRHDGARWLLDDIEPARGDRTDLAGKPPVPPLMDWRRDDIS